MKQSKVSSLFDAMQEFRPLIDFTKSEPHWRDRKGRSLLTAADPIKAAPKLFLLLLLLIGFFTIITFADTNCGSQPRALARTQCAMNVTSVCFPDIELGRGCVNSFRGHATSAWSQCGFDLKNSATRGAARAAIKRGSEEEDGEGRRLQK